MADYAAPPPSNEPVPYGYGAQPTGKPEHKRIPKKPTDFFVFSDYTIPLWTAWDVPRAQAAIDGHSQGQFYNSALLVEAMMSDDAYDAVMNTRVLGLTSRDLIIKPSKQLPGAKAQKIADEIRERWDQLFPQHVVDSVLSGGLNMGFQLAQIIWHNEEKLWLPELQPWHAALTWYNITTRTYVANTLQGQTHIFAGQGNWLLFAPYGQYRGWMRGAVRSCWVPYLARQYALRDWARYNEVHGLPIKKAIVPESASTDDKITFSSSIANLGNETTVMLPQGMPGMGGDQQPGFDLDLLEAKADTWEAFEGLVTKCETRMAIRLLGQNLTTEVDAGSLAAANVHDRVRLDYTRADDKQVAGCFVEQVLRPFCRFNYGDERLAPLVAWNTDPPEDKQVEGRALMEVSGAVANFVNSRAPVDMRKLLKKHGVPELPEGEEPPPPPDPGAPVEKPPMGGGGEGKTSRATLASRKHAHHAVVGQLYADNLADKARGQSVGAMRAHLRRVQNAVATARDYDDLRRKLKRVLGQSSNAKLAKLVERALVMAELAGRHAVNQER